MNFKAWNTKDKYMCKSKRSLSTIIVNQLTGNIIGDGFHCYNKAENNYILLQGTGIPDRNGNEIFADDLLKDNKGNEFRIYHICGGFVKKASAWAKSFEDMVLTDQLVVEPLADPQLRSWIKQNCEIIGNYHETI